MIAGPVDVIVVGGGISGLWAARCCLDEGLRPLIVEPELPGGLVANVGQLSGFLTEQSGIDLATGLLNPLLDAGVELIPGRAESVRSCSGRVTVRVDGKPRQARAAILAALRTSPRLAALITAIGMSIFLQNYVQLLQGARYARRPRNVHNLFGVILQVLVGNTRQVSQWNRGIDLVGQSLRHQYIPAGGDTTFQMIEVDRRLECLVLKSGPHDFLDG